MANLMIRDVDDALKQALVEEARRSNRSLNAQVLSVLQAHVEERRRRARMAGARGRAEEFREALCARHGLLSDSAEDIRQDRESR